jgi:hypothetical protein
MALRLYSSFKRICLTLRRGMAYCRGVVLRYRGLGFHIHSVRAVSARHEVQPHEKARNLAFDRPLALPSSLFVHLKSFFFLSTMSILQATDFPYVYTEQKILPAALKAEESEVERRGNDANIYNRRLLEFRNGKDCKDQ